MDIDRDAPATAEGELQIVAPPQIVAESWRTFGLADVERRREVDHGRRAPRARHDVPVEVRLDLLVSTLQAVDEPRELGWTGVTMGIHAVHVFRFEPTDGGTLARSAESFRGFIPSVLKGYSRKVLQRGIDNILRSLKTEAERRASAASA